MTVDILTGQCRSIERQAMVPVQNHPLTSFKPHSESLFRRIHPRSFATVSASFTRSFSHPSAVVSQHNPPPCSDSHTEASSPPPPPPPPPSLPRAFLAWTFHLDPPPTAISIKQPSLPPLRQPFRPSPPLACHTDMRHHPSVRVKRNRPRVIDSPPPDSPPPPPPPPPQPTHPPLPRSQSSSQKADPSPPHDPHLLQAASDQLERRAARAEARSKAQRAEKALERQLGPTNWTHWAQDLADPEITSPSTAKRVGVVQKIARRHRLAVEKREKQRRLSRLARIAALDPLQEARGRREDRFTRLQRLYGGRLQDVEMTEQPSRSAAATAEPSSPAQLPVHDDQPPPSRPATPTEAPIVVGSNADASPISQKDADAAARSGSLKSKIGFLSRRSSNSRRRSASSEGGDLDAEAQIPLTSDMEPIPETDDFNGDMEHSSDIVDTLDVVDPGISVVGHLSNIGNSIIFPYIPSLYDRRPVIQLPQQQELTLADLEGVKRKPSQSSARGRAARKRSESPGSESEAGDRVVVPSEQIPLDDVKGRHHHQADSSQQLLLQQDELEREEAEQLDAHVHELLTKRQKFKRVMQGVWAFVKTPQGIAVAIYGFLVVFSGAALVIFLLGWVDHGKNKDYWVELWSQFVNALFTITGVGLIPWRVRDTYRMIRIAHYQHLTWRLRRERGLPKLKDRNDIPTTTKGLEDEGGSSGKDRARVDGTVLASTSSEKPDELGRARLGHVELASVRGPEDETSIPSLEEEEEEEEHEEQVLSARQARKLDQLQTDFRSSQSWYRPHETATHHAFPISYALAITLLNDWNSIFQCMLCGVMWGYATHYKDRPAWTTGSLIPLSFGCGIGSAVLIWKGGEKTKKKREVEERLLEAFRLEIEERVRREVEREGEVANDRDRESNPSSPTTKGPFLATAPASTIGLVRADT
ncbi:hypothetical protein IE53DRAFT_391059 [Violaceomyces palustris]|uniref:Uncharacterized protein n=1 Tax=Violaceomyces palustris TaxID=1673888 RepID=A0ACD0NLT4_9BASI|nr:hypothetical protein IE53DRAFT_391059 [Violaceomyces palustris]